MEQAEFQNRVRMAASRGCLTPESVDYAIRHYVQHVVRLDKGCVTTCVQLAGLFDESYRASAQPVSQSVDHHLTSERAITTEARIRWIRPWIEQLRGVLFSDAKAHFTSLASAVGRLRNLLRQTYDWSPEAAARHLPDESRAAVLELLSTEDLPEEYLFEQLWGLREALRAGDLEACMHAVDAWNEGDPPVKLPPVQEGLRWVDIQLSDIAQAIGCSDAEILAYVLANVRPTLHPVTIAT